MAIQKGDFIKLNYTGRFEDGRIFDTTDEELAKKEEIFNPQGLYGGDVVIVGAGHTIQGLDEDFDGKEAGYSGTVSIPPEKAFGPRNPTLVETVSITKFQDRNVHPGQPVELDGRRGVVSRVIGRRVTVDFNSPFAGKTVNYEYNIEKVLEDNVEKIQGLLALYTGIRDTEVEIDDCVAKINVPTGLTFNQRWLMAKNRVATELFKYADLKEIQFIEKVTAEAEVPAPAEPEVEAETEAETEAEAEAETEAEVKEEPSESQE
ncbi:MULTISPECIES: peptidylprolyl isomerase [unclassified Methanosarcina]|uniref:peptidylprolyl isomerase n=1 Tax=unclassified Methanosarcina TaxID=2644672 RepID=UPI000615A98A|nr:MULTISPECIES: peptidylprolyl isomerase [unclassified Methanosarcina]AKB19985.1 Peptidyl-prolyl cis-trans isomerase [Methanosarcina sp. WWM596]AKB22222.1 Peptidyl-prolyl cis-trans isomerase [Methanosarcina sp. WH1]